MEEKAKKRYDNTNSDNEEDYLNEFKKNIPSRNNAQEVSKTNHRNID